MSLHVAAVIPAAGLGVRLGGTFDEPAPPKALRLLRGRPLLEYAVRSLAAELDEIVVAAPAGREAEVVALVSGLGPTLRVVAGGGSRQESVALALAAVSDGITHVLVHDAARPLAPAAMIRRVVDALAAGARIVVPVVPAVDSLRSVRAYGSNQRIDRAAVRAVQTPQGFEREVLVRAHAEAAGAGATDDAGLAERLGERVTLVEGDPLAFKVTTTVDLLLAEAVLAATDS
ncbi:MAG: 2-C-methyl-D-erythritol 4-phosphate cytidylyltransferase [Nocardioidaceae bacterium]